MAKLPMASIKAPPVASPKINLEDVTLRIILNSVVKIKTVGSIAKSKIVVAFNDIKNIIAAIAIFAIRSKSNTIGGTGTIIKNIIAKNTKGK